MSMFGILLLIVGVVYGSYVQVYEKDRDIRKEIKDAEHRQNGNV